MTSLTSLTLKAALDGLADKSFSSEELTKAHVEAVAAAKPLNAFVLETPERPSRWPSSSARGARSSASTRMRWRSPPPAAVLTKVPGIAAAVPMATAQVPIMAWCSLPIDIARTSKSTSLCVMVLPLAAV